jgi:N-acetylmuramoyl-L-alanine amidase
MKMMTKALISRTGALLIAWSVLCIAPAQALTLQGIPYQGVRATAASLGLSIRLGQDGKTIFYAGPSDRVQMRVDKRDALINGTTVVLNFPIAESKDYIYISSLDVEKTLRPLIRPESYTPALRLRHIVIDPGHGGKDNGAENHTLRLKEKILALDIAKRLAENLREMGYKVTLTRTDDHFLELSDRPALANELGADLFLSIHLNASPSPAISGAEVYTYPPQGAPSAYRSSLTTSDTIAQPANRNDLANLWLGYCLQKALSSDLQTPDRGLKHARLKVLGSPRCPAALIESGFISSSTEGSRLGSGLYRQQIADAIAAGVRAYHKMIWAR